jgi:CheY-like chemotaxis protein
MPIIAVTAHATEAYEKQCMTAGMDSYISKPLQPNRMLKK